MDHSSTKSDPIRASRRIRNMQLALARPVEQTLPRRRPRVIRAGNAMAIGKTGSEERNDLSGLMLQVGKGDRDAFARLFEHLAPRIKAYLIRLGSEPSAAEDLAQDVMVTIWHKAAGFDPARSSVMTWTFVIARNRRIDSLRREHSTVTYGHSPPDVEAEPGGADEAMVSEQSDALMRDAIASLSPEQQQVVRMSFFDDEPHSAIAAALDVPLGTVKSRLRLAFAKLRSRMENMQ